MRLNLTKTGGGFIPADDMARDYLDKCVHGTLLTCDIKKPRNAKFHRKYFGLLDTIFNWWEPEPDSTSISKWGTPEKNRERFRKDLIILAGYYEPVFNINSELRVEAKSISFANMDDDEFAELYSRTIDAALKILPRHIKREDIDNAVNDVLSFV